MRNHQWLDMRQFQRFAKQGVVLKIDLSDREVIGRPPIAVDQAQFLRLKGRLALGQRCGVGFQLQVVGGLGDVHDGWPRSRPARRADELLR
jgi:hypothetical protein